MRISNFVGSFSYCTQTHPWFSSIELHCCKLAIRLIAMHEKSLRLQLEDHEHRGYVVTVTSLILLPSFLGLCQNSVNAFRASFWYDPFGQT